MAHQIRLKIQNIDNKKGRKEIFYLHTQHILLPYCNSIKLYYNSLLLITCFVWKVIFTTRMESWLVTLRANLK